ncbi:MAG: OmpA family protein [Desulfobacteraceae bacterium]|nr:chalcone isomerase family protein [Desulfobacteraceae bacterium]MBC2756376.1 OmpA family protein [Desulfobacteraceae bacterium]
MLKKVLIALMLVLMLVTVSSARTINEIDFPETLTFGKTILLLNGGGTREAFLNDVYVAGLWLTKPMTDPAEIKDADEAMAIRMHVTNDFFASSKNITKAFNNGFRNSMPRGDISSIQEKVDKFKACFAGEITDDEEFDIVYIPGVGVSVYKDGLLKDTVPGYEFKKSVWSIWMHETRPADEDLKLGMAEGSISEEALAAKEEWIAKIKDIKEDLVAKAEASRKAKSVAEAKAVAEAQVAAEVQVVAEAKAAEEAAMAAKAVAVAQVAEEAAAAETQAAKEAKAAEEAAMKAKAGAKAEAKAAAAKAQKAAAAAEAQKTSAMADATPLTKAEFINEDVYFGLNSAALDAKAKQTLTMKAMWMKSNPVASVAVEVYCDSRGSVEYNKKLAVKRAKSVAKYMVEQGIDDSRLEIVIFGAVDSVANENAWANNRRAHFRVK